MPQDRRELYHGGTAECAEDAELRGLGAEFEEKHRRFVKLVECQERSTGELPLEDRQEVVALMQAKQQLAEAIADRPAATVIGLRVKAAVLLAYSQYDFEGRLHWTDHDELMGWSIARDLLDDQADPRSEGALA